MPLIPTLGRQREVELHEFEASWVYKVYYLKPNKTISSFSQTYVHDKSSLLLLLLYICPNLF